MDVAGEITKTVDKISRRNGVVGQYAYDVTVTYHFPDAEPQTYNATFVGSDHGAPVVMRDKFGERFVEDWRRYGDELNPDWIRRFYA
ncbi:hypothetical protein MAHJHV61_00620 [Mycobacterium avium subsp. hominissuis]